MSEERKFRIFDPEEHKKLEYINKKWTETSINFGFQQYKTSLLESYDLYDKKTSEELLNEQAYTLKDKKNRHWVIRPEITPSVAAMVGDKSFVKKYKKPYKLFSIGSVFRYESEQKGRKKEHIQFNADIFGVSDIWADVEIIDLASSSLLNMGMKKKDFIVYINDRKHIESKLLGMGVYKNELRPLLRTLDKIGKVSDKELETDIKNITNVSLKEIRNTLKEEPNSCRELRERLSDKINIQYNPNMVRGFDYYTGIVFEIFAGREKRSLCGGGRYDDLVSKYSNESIEAVGFGMGDVVLGDVMDTKNMEAESYDILIFVEEERFIEKAQKISMKKRENNESVSFVGKIKEDSAKKIAKEQGAKEVLRVDENTKI